MDTMLDKISSELILKNITFDPNNQQQKKQWKILIQYHMKMKWIL